MYKALLLMTDVGVSFYLTNYSMLKMRMSCCRFKLEIDENIKLLQRIAAPVKRLNAKTSYTGAYAPSHISAGCNLVLHLSDETAWPIEKREIEWLNCWMDAV